MSQLRTSAALAATFPTLALALGVPVSTGEVLISIPPGIASHTLNEWSAQVQVQVLFDYQSLHRIHTHGVAGTLRPSDAIDIMLRDTGFTFDWINPRTIAVIRAERYCRPELGAAAPLPPCVRLIGQVRL